MFQISSLSTRINLEVEQKLDEVAKDGHTMESDGFVNIAGAVLL